MPANVRLPEDISGMVRPNVLFVYGIFLDPVQRQHYGMSNPEYATVADYLTTSLSGHIVEAQPAPAGVGIQLTGLCVDVDPEYWLAIDLLESGYERRRVMTSNGAAWMYAKPEED